MRSSLFILVSLFVMNMSFALDDHSIKSEVDVQGFVLGSDSDLGGGFNYIVDRTTGLCFASMTATSNGRGSAVTAIPCEPLKKIKTIKKYMETGKTP